MRKDFARFGRSWSNQETSSSTFAPLLDATCSFFAGALPKCSIQFRHWKRLNKRYKKKTGLATCAVCSFVLHVFLVFVLLIVTKIPRHNRIHSLEMLYPEVQNIHFGLADWYFEASTRQNCKNSSRCQNAHFWHLSFPNKTSNKNELVVVSHPSNISQTGHLPQFWGAELKKYLETTTQKKMKDPPKSWKLQWSPMSSSPCAQSRINSNSPWLFKSPRGFWLRRWISSNNCIANKKSPRVSSRNGQLKKKKTFWRLQKVEKLFRWKHAQFDFETKTRGWWSQVPWWIANPIYDGFTIYFPMGVGEIIHSGKIHQQ